MTGKEVLSSKLEMEQERRAVRRTTVRRSSFPGPRTSNVELQIEFYEPYGFRCHKNSGSFCCLAIQRAKTKNASLRRFRNRTRAGSRGSSLPNRTHSRSARRQTVLAWCNKLEIFRRWRMCSPKLAAGNFIDLHIPNRSNPYSDTFPGGQPSDPVQRPVVL